MKLDTRDSDATGAAVLSIRNASLSLWRKGGGGEGYIQSDAVKKTHTHIHRAKYQLQFVTKAKDKKEERQRKKK